MDEGTHVTQSLPYLVTLACPVMHLFHGYGHGHHGQHDHGQQKDPRLQP